jgi:DNA polymerase III subunit alpha
MVDAIHGMDMSAVALTDHGYLYALPDLQKAAKDKGVKSILGCEAYIVDSVDRVRNEMSRKRFHQLLLAKNQVGYNNLVALMSWAARDGLYYKPLIDFEKLKEHSEGLIVTSSCMQGFANQTLLGAADTPGFEQTQAVREEEALKIHRWYKEVFGDDYYLEVHRHGIPEEDHIAAFLETVQRTLDIKVISANDCHYVEKADFHLQDALVCMGTKKFVSDKERMQIAHENLHIKTAEEMIDLFPEFPDAAETTLEIADKCNAEITFYGDQGKYLFPQFPLPTQFTQPRLYLRHLVRSKFYERYPRAYDDLDYRALVGQRVKHELSVIEDMGFEEYFLIVQDITTSAREMGVSVGPGRGSAAGSAVCYILGITDIEPLEYSLIFERFLNPERVSMPDIDIDFSDEGRQMVIDYITDKYGSDRVCQIVAFSTLGAASGIQNFSRVLSIPYSDANALTKKIPDDPKTRSRRLSDLANEIPEIGRLRDLDDEWGKMYEYADKAHNFPRHTSVHAAGLVITPDVAEKFVPTMLQSKTKTVTTQWDGSLLDSLGLVKMDILGLKTLAVIDRAVDLLSERPGVDLEETWEDMKDPKDPKVFETVFKNGDTIGVFQFESPGMKRWLSELQPSDFNDLIAMTSLYRPGPMDLIPDYVARKHGREKVRYPHPALEEVLAPTYGIPVYQEQVMQMAQVMAGYTLGQADLLRRAMGKKKVSEMAKHRAIFRKGCDDLYGLSIDQADSIFDMMESFAGYGFNKSHAAAYSKLSYMQGWLLTYYPVEYFAATLDRAKFEEVQAFIQEARTRGIQVLPPCINSSGVRFEIEHTPKGPAVRYGLKMLKKVGTEGEKVVKKRPKGGYASFEHFVDTCIPRQNVLDVMILTGCLDECESPERRPWMLANSKAYLKYVREVQKKKYGKRKSDPVPPDMTDDVPEWTEKNRLFQELEYAGAFLSGHPLGAYQVLADALMSGRKYDLGRKDSQLFVGTVVDSVKITTRKGNPMWFVQVSTGSEIVKFSVFERTYGRFGSHLQPEKNVVIVASEWDGSYSTLEAVIPVEQAMQDWIKAIRVKVPDKDSARKAAGIFLDHVDSGEASLWIDLGDQVFCYEADGRTPDISLISELDKLGTVSVF